MAECDYQIEELQFNKINTCAACFRGKHGTVFFYTWAAHDPEF